MAATPEQGDASFEQEVANGSGAGVGSGAAAAEETAAAVAAVTSPQAITVNVMDDSRRPQKPPKSTPAVAPRAGYMEDDDDDDNDAVEGTTTPAESVPPRLIDECFAECAGTFFIVLFGTGVVSSAVLTGAHTGLWQVAAVWGFGVSLAIYCTASVSGAHLNPAVTLSYALLRPTEFPLYKMVPFMLAQLIGGFIGGIANLACFHTAINDFETQNNIVRGMNGSEASAMVFGEYFPNPAMYGTDERAYNMISPLGCMLIEGWGTAILMFVILALTERRAGVLGPHKQLAPFFIGFTVATLISLYAPLTQAGWNPARDFGPRLVAAMAGWGKIAIPGPRNGFWAYIVGPMLGAPLGGLIHDVAVQRGLARGESWRFCHHLRSDPVPTTPSHSHAT